MTDNTSSFDLCGVVILCSSYCNMCTVLGGHGGCDECRAFSSNVVPLFQEHRQTLIVPVTLCCSKFVEIYCVVPTCFNVAFNRTMKLREVLVNLCKGRDEF